MSTASSTKSVTPWIQLDTYSFLPTFSKFEGRQQLNLQVNGHDLDPCTTTEIITHFSFPLNCGWRLWCNVLNNSVYPSNTVADLSRHIIKELVLKIVPGISQFQRGGGKREDIWENLKLHRWKKTRTLSKKKKKEKKRGQTYINFLGRLHNS